MNLFRQLSPEEEQVFRTWAKDNYKPLEPIKGIWHPIVQDECVKINTQHTISCPTSLHQPSGS